MASQQLIVLNSDSEAEYDENVEPKKKARKTGLDWTQINSFQNPEKAFKWIQTENSWNIQRKASTELGDKIFYYCKS